MSRREIETVCTLAAHLAQRGASSGAHSIPCATPRCAADAMALQRLAQNIRNKAFTIEDRPWGKYLRKMADKTEAVLKPYGLVAEVDARGIVILGLPGNTAGGDTEGFAI